MIVLSADIGGTNSRFAIFEVNGGELSLIQSEWFKSKEVSTFKELLAQLSNSSLSSYLDKIQSTVVAGAGPVENGEVCSPPNIAWKIYKSDLHEMFPNSEKHLINDFLAQAYASISKCGKDAHIVKQGQKKDGAIAVIGPGTGLGKAYLNIVNGAYLGFPSEGGHAPFAPKNEEEFSFLGFVRSKLGREQVSWEDVSAGKSFSYMYEFYYKKNIYPAEVSKLISLGEADLVSDLYATIVGRICMAFALEVLSIGGIYIAGGVLAKNPKIVENPKFEEEFLNSYTQKAVLKDMPIYIIDNEDSGLWGGAQYSLSHISG